MPLLQYTCSQCGKEFEELVKKYDEPAYCPECGKAGVRSYAGCMYSATGKPPKKCSGNCKTCGGCH